MDDLNPALPSDNAGGMSTRVDPNPFYGRVAYTHALGIDQPVGIVRMNYGDRVNDHGDDVGYRLLEPFMISPIWNERGQPYLATFNDGGVANCQAPSNVGADTVLRCVYIGFASTWAAYMRPSFRPNHWHGSLTQDKQDATGTNFRRNRYYDSEKGRFTQEDPIGLAGGVNLYGFASGDPVNYGDPFGMCRNPTARGLGSLRCVLEDAMASGKTAAGKAWESYLKWRGANAGQCEAICIAIGMSGGMEVLGPAGAAGIAERIGAGHAFEKHVLERGEFQGLQVRTVKQMQGFVQEVMEHASGRNVRSLSRGRTAYWDDATGTIVIHDPHSPDLGTVFRRGDGRSYFDNLK